MRRPIGIATVTAAILIVLGIPFYSIKFTSVDAQVLPDSASARQVDNVMRAEFPPFRDTPNCCWSRTPRRRQCTRSRVRYRRCRASPTRNPPAARQRGRGDRRHSDQSYISDESRDAVNDIRDLPVPRGSQLLVTGAAAHFVDLQHSLETHAPFALAIVIVATLLVLFLMTGSVILPVKQLVMNCST
jgi:RND superfamily putative drug exporter